MGTLKDLCNSAKLRLESENLIGRSPRCGIRISSTVASAAHAALRWTPAGWEIKDLSSTNGSFYNGRRLAAGLPQLLIRGDIVAFGAPEHAWELVDDAPPVPMAVSDDGERVFGTDSITLPSTTKPSTTLFRGPDGSWYVDVPGRGSEPIRNGGDFEISGKRWRLFFPEVTSRTDSLQYDVRGAKLLFTVSRDERRVALAARVGSDRIDFGARANNDLLLQLARQRVRDETAGRDEGSRGWIHQDALVEALGSDPERINVDVFRIRKRFEPYFRNAAQIIERRLGTGQLRLGVPSIEIVTT